MRFLEDWRKKREFDNIAKLVRKEERKKRAEKRRLKYEEEQRIRKKYNDTWNKVIVFQGNIQEYESFKGYERGQVEAIDNGNMDKRVILFTYRSELYISRKYNGTRKELIDEGIEAFVNPSPSNIDISSTGIEREHYLFYALPVRKKKTRNN